MRFAVEVFFAEHYGVVQAATLGYNVDQIPVKPTIDARRDHLQPFGQHLNAVDDHTETAAGSDRPDTDVKDNP